MILFIHQIVIKKKKKSCNYLTSSKMRFRNYVIQNKYRHIKKDAEED